MPQPPGNEELDRLLPVVYKELRQIAGAYMRGERSSHTLQPTALVNEAYMRLFRKEGIEWKGRTHVLAMAALEMRRFLVEYARKRNALGGRGRVPHVTFDPDLPIPQEQSFEVLALDVALEKLAALDARQSEIAVCRMYGGMTDIEIGEHFGISERTVREDLRVAKAWLAHELAG